MLTPRNGLGLAATSDGKLHALGGGQADSDPYTNVLSSVETYDPATNMWAARASMPTKRIWLAAATAANGKVYAIGGVQQNYSPGLSTVEEYNPSSNTWTTKAGMPTARHSLAVVAANNGKLYAIGGSGAFGAVGTVEEFDPDANTWVTKTSMLTPRYHFAATLGPDGLIYAIGGGNGTQPVLNTVEAYDPVANTWTSRTGMMIGRISLGAATGTNGRIYTIGGSDGATLPFGIIARVEEYDPLTDTWVVRPSPPTSRAGMAVVTAANGKIYAVGGESSPFNNLATVEEATIQ